MTADDLDALVERLELTLVNGGWHAGDIKRSIAALTALREERDEWRQAAGVEAGLRREFLARAEAAETALAECRETLEVVLDFMKRDADSGDDALWTVEYADLYHKVCASAIRARGGVGEDSIQGNVSGTQRSSEDGE